MKLTAVRVGLAADLGPAHAARVVVLVAVRQDQEEVLSHGVGLLAARAEQARRLKLAEAVYHVGILDHNSVARPRSSTRRVRLRAQRLNPSDCLKPEKKSAQLPECRLSRPRWSTPTHSATIARAMLSRAQEARVRAILWNSPRGTIQTYCLEHLATAAKISSGHLSDLAIFVRTLHERGDCQRRVGGFCDADRHETRQTLVWGPPTRRAAQGRS